MDGGRSAYWKKNDRKRGAWSTHHFRPRPKDGGYRPQRRTWTSNDTSSYAINDADNNYYSNDYNVNSRQRSPWRWSSEDDYQTGYYYTPSANDKRYRHDHNSNYFYNNQEQTSSARRWREELPSDDRDGSFRRPREPRRRDYHNDRGSFRRTNSHDPTCRTVESHDQPAYIRRGRRDSDSSLSAASTRSGIDWDSSKSETPKISPRDPRLSRGQDYKTRLGTKLSDSDVKSFTLSSASASVAVSSVVPVSDSALASSVNSNKSDSKPFTHSAIMSTYDEMCANMKRTTAVYRTPGSNDERSSCTSTPPVSVWDRLGSTPTKESNKEAVLPTGHEASIPSDQASKQCHSDSHPSAICSMNLPADTSRRKVLAPKPSNIPQNHKTKSIVTFRASFSAQDSSHNLTTDLSEDVDLRKEVTAVERKPVLKKSTDQQRASRSSLASLTRKLPSNTCLTSCSRPSKKNKSKIRFSIPACVPGKRRTWNSLSSNYDAGGCKMSGKRSPRKTDKKGVNSGGVRSVVKSQGQALDKQEAKRTLFVTTFGEPVDIIKESTGGSTGKKTDSDAASALLMLSEPGHEDMPRLSPMCQDHRRSPVEFPPVLSPQSGHTHNKTTQPAQHTNSIKQEPDNETISAGEFIKNDKSDNTEARNTNSCDGQEDDKSQVVSSDSSVPDTSHEVKVSKKKRSRRTTVGGDDIQKDIDQVLKTGLVNSAISKNACYVKLCRIDESVQIDPKNESGVGDYVTTLLVDDVKRNDGNDQPDENKTENFKSSVKVEVQQGVDANGENQISVESLVKTPDCDDESVVEVKRRVSKKRTKINAEGSAAVDTCPSPTKVRVKSELKDVQFQQPVKYEFEKIQQFLQECHRQIPPRTDSERSLFSSILSETEKVTDMNDTTLPDLKSAQSMPKSIKVDIAKLKSILSPHRIKNQPGMMSSVKEAHSEHCVDIITGCISKLENMSQEIKNFTAQHTRSITEDSLIEFSEKFKMPPKRSKKSSKRYLTEPVALLAPDDLPTMTVKSSKSRRRKSASQKRPSVMVSLPLERGLADVGGSVGNDVGEVDRTSGGGSTAEVYAPHDERDQLTSAGARGAKVEPDDASLVAVRCGDTNEPDIAVNALLISQQQLPSPAGNVLHCRQNSLSDLSDNAQLSPEITDSLVSPRNDASSKAESHAKLTTGVSSQASLRGVVLSVSEPAKARGPSSEIRDALSDALTSSGLGTLVKKTQGECYEDQSLTEPSNDTSGTERKPYPGPGRHPAKYGSTGQYGIAGPPIPYRMLMPAYGRFPMPMIPVPYPVSRMSSSEHKSAYGAPGYVSSHGGIGGRPDGLRPQVRHDRNVPRSSCHVTSMPRQEMPPLVASGMHQSMSCQSQANEPRYTSPTRPVMTSPPSYSPRYPPNHVYRPFGGLAFSTPLPLPPGAPTSLVFRPPGQLSPQRHRFTNHVQRAPIWRPPARPQPPPHQPCQQITVDLNPRQQRRHHGQRDYHPDERRPLLPTLTEQTRDQQPDPLETVTYSDGVDVQQDECSQSDTAKMLTVTINNSLADSTNPPSDSSLNESDINRRDRTCSISSTDTALDVVSPHGTVPTNTQEADFANTYRFKRRSAKKTSSAVVEEVMRKVLETTPVDENVKKTELMNMKLVVDSEQADSTVDGWPHSTTDVHRRKRDAQMDVFPYIPKLHWQSEPLDLSVRQEASETEKFRPVDARKSRTSEEFFVGFPLRAQLNGERASAKNGSCVLSCGQSVERGMVPLAKIASHQVPAEKTVCYSPEQECTNSDNRRENMPALIQDPPRKTVLDRVRQAEGDHGTRERQLSFDRRKMLEENRNIMQRVEERPTNKEIVESRLQGVYSPLSQSTIDPNYPPVMYPPPYQYGLPFVPYSVVCQSGMIPVAPVQGGQIGFYPPGAPVPPYGPVFVPQDIHRHHVYPTLPSEPKKRKKKPRGLAVQKDAHPLSDVGATSEDSESQTSQPTSLKRRILDHCTSERARTNVA